jgi:hypothetical protein
MKMFALSFFLAAACATPTTAPAGAARDCGGMVSAIAAAGTPIRNSPDPTAEVIATLADATPVCAANESRGFGLRRVKLPDGRTGFVDEGSLQ